MSSEQMTKYSTQILKRHENSLLMLPATQHQRSQNITLSVVLAAPKLADSKLQLAKQHTQTPVRTNPPSV